MFLRKVLINIHNREIRLIDALDNRFNAVAKLLFALAEVVGNDQVEDYVGMRGARNHTEVVNGKARIYAGDERGDLIFSGDHRFVVGGYGVHVNNRIAGELFAKLFFDIVYHIVRSNHIGFVGYFSVQRDHHSAGAVVMNYEVVYSDNAVVRVNYARDLVYKLTAWRLAEQGAYGLFSRTRSREHNKCGHRKAAVRVDIYICHTRYDKAGKYGTGSNAVGEAVGGGCLHSGGVDAFTDIEVIVRHIRLDEYRKAEYDNGQPTEAYRLRLKDLCKRGLCKLKSDEQDDKRDDKSRDVFYSAVSEWVILIRLLL